MCRKSLFDISLSTDFRAFSLDEEANLDGLVFGQTAAPEGYFCFCMDVQLNSNTKCGAAGLIAFPHGSLFKLNDYRAKARNTAEGKLKRCWDGDISRL